MTTTYHVEARPWEPAPGGKRRPWWVLIITDADGEEIGVTQVTRLRAADTMVRDFLECLMIDTTDIEIFVTPKLDNAVATERVERVSRHVRAARSEARQVTDEMTAAGIPERDALAVVTGPQEDLVVTRDSWWRRRLAG